MNRILFNGSLRQADTNAKQTMPEPAPDREALMLEAAGEVVRDALAALRAEFQQQLRKLRAEFQQTLQALRTEVRPKKLRIVHEDGTESIITQED